MKLKNALVYKPNTAGWILTISFISMTFIPRSLDDTMFVDGLAYAAIARNMSHGLGSFWQPHFADSFWLTFNNRCPFFCEHPPLMFGMQAALFWLFGDTTFVENFYNLLVLVATVLLLSGVWRLLLRDNDFVRKQTWFPVMMWYGLRVVWWSMPNNLLDSTMAVFCLASVCLQLKAFEKNRQTFYLLVSAGMIVCAGLTKGPVGLFPIAFPLLYGFVYERRELITALLRSLALFLTVALIFSMILLNAPAWVLLSNYFEGQVVSALLGHREKVSNDWTAHFYLARLLFFNIVPHLAILLVLKLIGKRLKLEGTIRQSSKKLGALALLTSALIVLPMLASVKQGDYYLMPAMPFVGLFFAAITVDVVQAIFSRITVVSWTIMVGMSVLLVCTMAYKLLHQDRDPTFEIANDLAQIIPSGSKIYLPASISMCSEIHTPFQRYAGLSIAFNAGETDYSFLDNPEKCVLDSLRRTGEYRLTALRHGAFLAVRGRER
ncbi:hypothetical protein LZD49_01865 [Dyadobacter sp. CY261]|uniref:ArnT family glycosyltransferase n=1 Tax=Dyadobacter sp. CY261 TaxID=2907203 RepID=UPI001F28FF52|nr:hypothetical protein [Dyadobacter sp. CY261]MCF0069199.1 hypothetical protein [Dyadobacter sp. CY261]